MLAEKEERSGVDEWPKMRFSDAVLISPLVRLERGRPYPFVNMAAVNAGSRCAYALERHAYSGGGTRFRSGDTLMAWLTPCLENGKIARYCAPHSSDTAHGSTEFIVIRGRPNVTDTGFAYYLTQWEEVRNYAIGQMTGTSGRQRVQTKSLDHLTVTIPPPPEQRAIAHLLGTLDDKIDLNRRINATLEAMARGLFISWFVHFDPVHAKASLKQRTSQGAGAWPVARARAYLDRLEPEIAALFPDRFVDSELGPIPAGWAVKPLGDLIELAYDKALKADTIVGRKGNPGTVPWAASAYFPIDTTFYVVPKDSGTPSLPFLFYALQGQGLPAVAADSAVPGLNRNLASLNQQVTPPAPLVAHFGAQVERFFARRHGLEEESCTLAALRDTFLPKLVSGKLRIHSGSSVEKIMPALSDNGKVG